MHACLASYTHACKHSYNFKYMIVLPPCVCVTVRLHLFTHARRLVFFHPTQIQFYVRVCLFALQDSRDFHVRVCTVKKSLKALWWWSFIILFVWAVQGGEHGTRSTLSLTIQPSAWPHCPCEELLSYLYTLCVSMHACTHTTSILRAS